MYDSCHYKRTLVDDVSVNNIERKYRVANHFCPNLTDPEHDIEPQSEILMRVPVGPAAA